MEETAVPDEISSLWCGLSEEQKSKLLCMLEVGDSGTVDVQLMEDAQVKLKLHKNSPYQFSAKEMTHTVRNVDIAKRNAQVEAVVEMIESLLRNKTPRGLVFNRSKISVGPAGFKSDPDNFIKTGELLGTGNSAGEVIVVKDRKTGQDVAYKSIMMAQFHRDEIYAWLHLSDKQLSPELYHFELKDNRVIFTMEVVRGKSLENIIDELPHMTGDNNLMVDFAFVILHDLLNIFDALQSHSYTHGDIHAGNLLLEKDTLDLKIIDFGSARKFLTDSAEDSARRVKLDVVGIIRIFCALYSGYAFNDLNQALAIMQSRDLDKLNPFMQRISVEQREELYFFMMQMFHMVQDSRQSGFGDSSEVGEKLSLRMSEDEMKKIKKKVAAFVFPELFQVSSVDQTDGGLAETLECEELSACKPESIRNWDHPDIEKISENVTDKDLERLGVLFHQKVL